MVTGGCGFIGSNFVRYMLETHKGLQVVNLDKLTYAGRLENLNDVEKDSRYKFVKGDICNAVDVKNAMKDCDAVVNFAAESHVDRSIDDPSAFIKTNFFGVHVLLEQAKKQGIDKFVQISCYDKKSRALTTDGLKSFQELKKGDKVFSINPNTQKIEVKPVEKVIIQDYNGKLLHFKNKRINVMVTPNHRMFILNTKRKLTNESAEECSKRSIFFMPNGIWDGAYKEYYNLEGFGKIKTSDLLYLLGIFIGDGCLAYQEKKVKTKSGLNRTEFLKLARDKKGMFKETRNKSSYETICKSYRIFLDIPKNDKCRRRVEKTLENIGIKYQKHEGRAGTHLYFSSKEWLNFFKQCGQGAHNKKIPLWAMEYSPKLLKNLFEGLMDSDGVKRKVFWTVSEKLVGQFCELCIKIGLKSSIGKKHKLSFIGNRKIEGDSYCVVVSTTTKSISKNKIKKVDYSGKIWCLKIKDNKNFLVEREGKFDFCGNTDEVYGSVENGSSTETDLINPRNPYSAAKAAGDLLALSYFNTYSLPVCVTRSSNNFGPFQFPEKMIPLFATNLLEGKKVPVYGDGKNVRDWLYVLDNCEAIDLVLGKGRIGEIYNIGGGNEVENIDLTKMILKELDSGEDRIQYVEDRKGHDRRYSLSFKKIEKELGWKPKTEFKKALKETLQWYQGNEKWWKPLKK